MLLTVEAVAHCLDQSGNRLDAAVRGWFVNHLGAGIGPVEALQVDRPLLRPRGSLVGKLREFRLRLADGNKTLAEYLVAVAEADIAPLECQRINCPAAAVFRDGAALAV
jgi:hypothetical protein